MNVSDIDEDDTGYQKDHEGDRYNNKDDDENRPLRQNSGIEEGLVSDNL